MIEKNICRRCRDVECFNIKDSETGIIYRKKQGLNPDIDPTMQVELIPNSSIVGCVEPYLKMPSCNICFGKTCVNLPDGKSYAESISSKQSGTGFPIHKIVFDKRIQDCEKFKDILL